MAVVKPSQSLINIRSGIKSVRDSFSGINKKTGNVNKTLLKKTKVKRESISRNYILSQRRQEAERRKNREDLIEASSIGGVFKRQAKAVASSTKGFLGRIMDFLGTLLVGWLAYNLPSIITMAQELIARMQRLSTIVSGFFNNTVSIFRGFGNVLGAVGKNILTFDFTDSNKRVENAVKGLGNTFDDMQSQFDEGFRLLTTSLGEGVASGEDSKPFGTQYPNQSMQEPSAPSGGGGGGASSVGSPEQRAMLDAISFAEGTRDQPNGGYKTLFGFGQFDDYSKHPDKVVRSGGYASAAAGRYQFMPDTFNRLAKKLGLKDFSPQSQDKAALELAKELGITQNILKNEGISPRVSALLGRQWASFPGKSIGLDQPTKKLNSIQTAYKKSLGSPQTQTTPAQTSSAQAAVSTSVIDQFKGKPGGAAGIITSERGMRLNPRTGRYRMHQGIDIAPAGPGYYVALKLSGKVNLVAFDSGGYGNYVDIKSGNTIYRFAHLAKVYVKQGQTYTGQTIGEIGSTGGSTGIHLHFEVRPGGGDSINPRPYLNLLSIGKQLTGTSGQPTTISIPTPAQITPQGTQQRQQVSQQLSQQRNGPTIIVMEEDPPPQQQVSSGGGGGGIIPIIINPLNSFITKKLLLDLAYT